MGMGDTHNSPATGSLVEDTEVEGREGKGGGREGRKAERGSKGERNIGT